jgi:hypothetical protein
MCRYIYVYIYIYTYTYIHIHIYIYIYTYVHIHVHIYIYSIYLYIYMHTYIRIHWNKHTYCASFVTLFSASLFRRRSSEWHIASTLTCNATLLTWFSQKRCLGQDECSGYGSFQMTGWAWRDHEWSRGRTNSGVICICIYIYVCWSWVSHKIITRGFPKIGIPQIIQVKDGQTIVLKPMVLGYHFRTPPWAAFFLDCTSPG